jgi:hypothetical protein
MQRDPNMAIFLRVRSLLSWKGHQFFLTRIEAYSEHEFSLSSGKVSVSITIWGLPECVIHRPQTSQNISYKEAHFTVKEVCNSSRAWDPLLSYTESARRYYLIECRNDY